MIVALFDASLSADSGEIRERYREDFNIILSDLMANGGRLLIDRISANSLTGTDPSAHDFPIGGLNSNPLDLKQRREGAAEDAQAALDGILSTSGEEGTAILDALRNASELFEAYAGRTRFLVILSDMQEVSNDLKLGAKLKESDIPRILSQLRNRDLVSAMQDVDVYVTGVGVTADRPLPAQQVRLLERFWMAYFEEAGADLLDHRFRSTLETFP